MRGGRQNRPRRPPLQRADHPHEAEGGTRHFAGYGRARRSAQRSSTVLDSRLASVGTPERPMSSSTDSNLPAKSRFETFLGATGSRPSVEDPAETAVSRCPAPAARRTGSIETAIAMVTELSCLTWAQVWGRRVNHADECIANARSTFDHPQIRTGLRTRWRPPVCEPSSLGQPENRRFRFGLIKACSQSCG
jgi:hypothetical protein